MFEIDVIRHTQNVKCISAFRVIHIPSLTGSNSYVILKKPLEVTSKVQLQCKWPISIVATGMCCIAIAHIKQKHSALQFGFCALQFVSLPMSHRGIQNAQKYFGVFTRCAWFFVIPYISAHTHTHTHTRTHPRTHARTHARIHAHTCISNPHNVTNVLFLVLIMFPEQ